MARVGGTTFDQYDSRIGRVPVPVGEASDGRFVDIAFIHIASPDPDPDPPLFVFGAGPGGSGIREAQNVLIELPGVIEHRDIVGMDQRGVGLSGPDLTLAFTATFDARSELQGLLEAYRELADKVGAYWRGRGVELSDYTTWHAAGDVDEIRRALGYDRIALFGFSYGSHLGLAVLRRIPNSVERAAFMAVEGPDHTLKTPAQVQRGLEAVEKLVREDPDLAAVVPSLIGLLTRVIARVAIEPALVEVVSSTGTAFVTVTEWDVRRFTAGRLGRRRSIEALPAQLVRMDRGDFSEVASDVLRWRRSLSMSALLTASDCASGASHDRWQEIERTAEQTVLGDVINFPLPHVCDALGVEQLGDFFRGRIESSVPVLLVSGGLDSRTPPENALDVAAGLSEASILVVENEGHDIYTSQHVVRFLIDGEADDLLVLRCSPLRFDPVAN